MQDLWGIGNGSQPSLTTRAIPYSSPGKGVGGSVVRKGWVHKSGIKRAKQVGSRVGQMVSEIQD